VVEHVQDRQLARLLRSKRPGFHTAAAAAAWEQAFSGCLSSLAGQASRPLQGPVPPGALAVVFLDLPELLACLALDLLKGDAANRWWWRAIYPSRAYQAELLRELQQAPQLIPAVVEHLALQGQCAAFASQLGEKTCLELALAVLSVFQLEVLSSLLERVTDGNENHTSGREAARQPLQGGDATQRPPVLNQTGPSAPPPRKPQSASTASVYFQHLLDATPESQAPGLPLAGRCLLAISIGLQRFPAALRALASAAAASDPVLAQFQTMPADLEAGRQEPAVWAAFEVAPADLEALSPAIGHTRPASQPTKTSNQASPQALTQQPITGSSAAALVRTRYGGLFYLLNLAIHLGLYNDFTQPANPGWALSPWALLALLGVHWLGPELPPDPIWPLLLRLAGQPDGQDSDSGVPFLSELTASFTPPHGWLAELNIQPTEQTQAQPTPDELALAGSTWLANLAAVMQNRLAQAFGHDHPLDMLSQPARIWVSSTRLEIHFNLASHPIEVRLSGLDRDPGWLPAAGRYIYYHYDA